MKEMEKQVKNSQKAANQCKSELTKLKHARDLIVGEVESIKKDILNATEQIENTQKSILSMTAEVDKLKEKVRRCYNVVVITCPQLCYFTIIIFYLKLIYELHICI